MVVKTQQQAENKKIAAVAKYKELKVSIDEIKDTKYDGFRDQSDTDAIDVLTTDFDKLLSDGDFFTGVNNFTEAFLKFNAAYELADARTSKSLVKTVLKKVKNAEVAAAATGGTSTTGSTSATGPAPTTAITGHNEFDNFLNSPGDANLKTEAINLAQAYSIGSQRKMEQTAESFRKAAKEAGDKPDARQFSFVAADALKQAEKLAKEMHIAGTELVNKLNDVPPPSAAIVDLVNQLEPMGKEITNLETKAAEAASNAENTPMPPRFKKKKITYL